MRTTPRWPGRGSSPQRAMSRGGGFPWTTPIFRRRTRFLEALSQDPKAQALARWRKDQLRLHRIEMAAIERRCIEKGIEQGRDEEREKQRAELRATVRQLCGLFEIDWTPERESAIATWTSTSSVPSLRAPPLARALAGAEASD